MRRNILEYTFFHSPSLTNDLHESEENEKIDGWGRDNANKYMAWMFRFFTDNRLMSWYRNWLFKLGLFNILKYLVVFKLKIKWFFKIVPVDSKFNWYQFKHANVLNVEKSALPTHCHHVLNKVWFVGNVWDVASEIKTVFCPLKWLMSK